MHSRVRRDGPMCVTRPSVARPAPSPFDPRAPIPTATHRRTSPACYTGLRAKHASMKVPTMTASRSPAAVATCAIAGCAGAAGLRPSAAQRPQPFAQSAGPSPATSCLSAQCIFVTNPTDSEIPRVAGRVLIFPANANGDAPPAAKIAGSKTHLGHPCGIAVDAQHNVYVANLRSVGVYAPGTYGNAPPTRLIAGPQTKLLYPSGIAVDATGQIRLTIPPSRARPERRRLRRRRERQRRTDPHDRRLANEVAWARGRRRRRQRECLRRR